MVALSRACHHRSDPINHSFCPSRKMQLLSPFLNPYLWAQGGAKKKGGKHDAACSSRFQGVAGHFNA